MSMRVMLAAAVAVSSLVVSAAQAGGAVDPDSSRTFLTGGGWIGDGDQKVTFGLRLSCEQGTDAGPEQLEVNLGGGTQFRLAAVDEAACAVGADEKEGGIYRGTGTGECNGQPAAARYVFRAPSTSSAEEPSAAIQVIGDDPVCDVFIQFQSIAHGNFAFHQV